mmetsp:Transcript_46351/g.107923  ORF Transcript_46351/g.107923 Transcript_46351/m.107923 type:complete len:249 (+) Transcript_46351:188-934(+)
MLSCDIRYTRGCVRPLGLNLHKLGQIVGEKRLAPLQDKAFKGLHIHLHHIDAGWGLLTEHSVEGLQCHWLAIAAIEVVAARVLTTTQRAIADVDVRIRALDNARHAFALPWCSQSGCHDGDPRRELGVQAQRCVHGCPVAVHGLNCKHLPALVSKEERVIAQIGTNVQEDTVRRKLCVDPRSHLCGIGYLPSTRGPDGIGYDVFVCKHNHFKAFFGSCFCHTCWDGACLLLLLHCLEEGGTCFRLFNY